MMRFFSYGIRKGVSVFKKWVANYAIVSSPRSSEMLPLYSEFPYAYGSIFNRAFSLADIGLFPCQDFNCCFFIVYFEISKKILCIIYLLFEKTVGSTILSELR